LEALGRLRDVLCGVFCAATAQIYGRVCEIKDGVTRDQITDAFR